MPAVIRVAPRCRDRWVVDAAAALHRVRASLKPDLTLPEAGQRQLALFSTSRHFDGQAATITPKESGVYGLRPTLGPHARATWRGCPCPVRSPNRGGKGIVCRFGIAESPRTSALPGQALGLILR